MLVRKNHYSMFLARENIVLCIFLRDLLFFNPLVWNVHTFFNGTFLYTSMINVHRLNGYTATRDFSINTSLVKRCQCPQIKRQPHNPSPLDSYDFHPLKVHRNRTKPKYVGSTVWQHLSEMHRVSDWFFRYFVGGILKKVASDFQNTYSVTNKDSLIIRKLESVYF